MIRPGYPYAIAEVRAGLVIMAREFETDVTMWRNESSTTYYVAPAEKLLSAIAVVTITQDGQTIEH